MTDEQAQAAMNVLMADVKALRERHNIPFEFVLCLFIEKPNQKMRVGITSNRCDRRDMVKMLRSAVQAAEKMGND